MKDLDGVLHTPKRGHLVDYGMVVEPPGTGALPWRGETMTFIRLHDGTTLEKLADGTYRPVQPMTDWAYLDGLSEDQIETVAATDPDHPALDDAFWEGADADAARSSIRLEADVIDFFQQSGGGYEMRINAVLREYVANRRRSSGA